MKSSRSINAHPKKKDCLALGCALEDYSLPKLSRFRIVESELGTLGVYVNEINYGVSTSEEFVKSVHYFKYCCRRRIHFSLMLQVGLVKPIIIINLIFGKGLSPLVTAYTGYKTVVSACYNTDRRLPDHRLVLIPLVFSFKWYRRF